VGRALARHWIDETHPQGGRCPLYANAILAERPEDRPERRAPRMPRFTLCRDGV
jgi:hypothetical protein